jgi:hypothetical protein
LTAIVGPYIPNIGKGNSTPPAVRREARPAPAIRDRIDMTFGGDLRRRDAVKSCVTMELPWKGNATASPHSRRVIRLQLSLFAEHNARQVRARGRSRPRWVEIHIGYTDRRHKGCVLGLGRIGKVDGSRGVGDSEKAFEKFMAWAGGEDFELVITDPSPEVA